MRLVAGVLHITGVASNCYAGDKMVCMQINTKSQRNTDKIGIFSFERTANVSDFNEMIELQGYRILCGLINNIAYVSIDIRWIRLQFKCAENDYVYCRSIFGSHAKRDWNRIA